MRVWLALLAGCALTSKSAPLDVRYFTLPDQSAAAASGEGTRTPLRLGRVVPGSLLGARIVHRDSPLELAPYEAMRWSDDPDVYVRRALVHAVFDTQPFEQATDGAARTLDVDVVAFEEVRHGPRRSGRVELRYAVRDDRRVVAHGTVAAERDAGPGIEGVVAAIGEALDAASADLAERVTTAIAAR